MLSVSPFSLLFVLNKLIPFWNALCLEIIFQPTLGLPQQSLSVYVSAHLSLALYDPLDCSPPGSSVQGILQVRILEWVVMLSSRSLPNPGIEPTSFLSPALPGRFFTTSDTWEAPSLLWNSSRLLPVWLSSGIAFQWTAVGRLGFLFWGLLGRFITSLFLECLYHEGLVAVLGLSPFTFWIYCKYFLMFMISSWLFIPFHRYKMAFSLLLEAFFHVLFF